MKSSYKVAYSAGAVALILAGVAHSEPTKNVLDNWTVNNGIITAGCDAGSFTSCGAALVENGFFSRQVVDQSTGKQYFQTIITMPGATALTPADRDKLAFSDENLVSFGGTNGIIDKQRLYQADVLPVPGTFDTHEVIFKTDTIVGTGWATDFVDLTQSISDPTATGGDGFQTNFLYKQVGYADEPNGRVPTGKGMKITSYIPVIAADRQDFVLVNKQGDFNTANGSVSLPGPTGGTVNWSGDSTPGANTGTRGDQIQALWVGQQLAVAGTQFGFTSYSNIAPSAIPADAGKIGVFSLTDTAAVNWDQSIWGDLNTVGTITAPFAP
jgi:hypothetical protein